MTIRRHPRKTMPTDPFGGSPESCPCDSPEGNTCDGDGGNPRRRYALSEVDPGDFLVLFGAVMIVLLVLWAMNAR